jgi:hypothetical protein
VYIYPHDEVLSAEKLGVELRYGVVEEECFSSLPKKSRWE